jgi:hypothetical protein
MNSGRMRNDGNSGTTSVQKTVSFGNLVARALLFRESYGKRTSMPRLFSSFIECICCLFDGVKRCLRTHLGSDGKNRTY